MMIIIVCQGYIQEAEQSNLGFDEQKMGSKPSLPTHMVDPIRPSCSNVQLLSEPNYLYPHMFHKSTLLTRLWAIFPPSYMSSLFLVKIG